MYKFFVLLFCMHILCNSSSGQGRSGLSGMVSDEDGQPLPGAAVYLSPVEKGAVTDNQGKFAIHDIPEGIYSIEISFIGYNLLSDTLKIDGDKIYNARLTAVPLDIMGVVIIDDYTGTRKKEEPLNIEILREGYLRQNLGGSLMNSLERLPGVSAITIGAGQSKPVIRGLAFNRLVVVENNIKHEAQQWGADHGLEIDQYAIDNIEVIKGPASLMYGSDAIGGVIDIKKRRFPAENSIGGTIDLSGKTNNDYLGTSVSLFGRRERFFADFRATILDRGDYKVPTDSIDIYSYRAALHENHLRNTAGREQNLHLSFGLIERSFQSKFFISSLNGKSGFFANTHGLEPRNVNTELHDRSSREINYPYHSVGHFKLINTSRINRENYTIESDLGFQRNLRKELSPYTNHGYMPPVFPDTMDFSPNLERQFEKYVYSGNLKLSWFMDDRTRINIGVNSEYQDNRVDGRGFIIPEFQQLNIGGYALGRYFFSGRSMIRLGIRYDHGNISTREYRDWFPSPVAAYNDTTFQFLKRAGSIDRGFSNLSWSAGYTFTPENWTLKTNIGKSFRMPIAKELAANGVNYHNFSYEVGNPGLSPEISYQIDGGAEYSTGKFSIEVSPFLNYFGNYIYLNPTPDYDRLYGGGHQVYNYVQSQVLRYGGELHARYQLFESLQFGILGEYIYSEQLSGEKRGFTLPFSPPASAILNVSYQKPRLAFAENAYLSFDYRVTASQYNIVPPEETTDGYQVLNLRTGGEIQRGSNRINISLQVLNLFNNRYFNHTSYYRLINVPEPGRNFIMNIYISF